MTNAADILHALQQFASKARAKQSQRYFKTGKGEYAEGDIFLGIRNPDLLSLAKKCRTLDLEQVQILLYNQYHEARLLAAMILVEQYQRTKDPERKNKIAAFYLHHTPQFNNWDLVDCSAYKILGPHLYNAERAILYEFASAEDLWLRRIAIITTLYFIKQEPFDDALKLAVQLLNDPHDLIHKAVGWML